MDEKVWWYVSDISGVYINRECMCDMPYYLIWTEAVGIMFLVKSADNCIMELCFCKTNVQREAGVIDL
jgi:hypothetical protein